MNIARSLALAVTLFAAQAASSAPYGYGPPGASSGSSRYAQEAPEAVLVVRDGVQRLREFLSSDTPPGREELRDFLDQELGALFDFEGMARLAAGPMVRGMSQQQFESLESGMRQHFLMTLLQRLAGFSDQQARVVRYLRAPGADTAVVTIAIMNPGTYPARLDFRLREGDSGWRIYDVVANGSSAAMFYRRQFMHMMRGRPGPHGPPR